MSPQRTGRARPSTHTNGKGPVLGGRIPPHNLQAEESLLGAMLLSRDAIAAAVEACTADDFYKPAHGHIFDAVCSLYAQGEPADPVTVADELRRADLLDAIGGPATLITLQANTPATTNAGRYAHIVEEHAVLRRVIAVASGIVEMGHSVPADVAQAVEAATVDLAATIRHRPGPATGPVNLADFLAAGDTEYDWLIPGLLERGDRLIVTGLEGCGKSTLLRQLALQAGAGLHPFTWAPIPPARVLLVDLENGERHVRRKLRELRAVVEDPTVDNRVYVECLVGLDLLNTAGVAHLEHLVDDVKPDLLIIGPLYKMAGDDPTAEEPARAVAAVLDRIRSLHGCAVILEAHTPHGDQERPYGASLWKRWPEFGIFLAPDGQLRHWRGQRDERDWPGALRRSTPWPWELAMAPAPAEPWDGPTRCKEAVLALLRGHPGVEMSINVITDQLRTQGTSFHRKAVSVAADELAVARSIRVRNGPRGSHMCIFTEEQQDEIF